MLHRHWGRMVALAVAMTAVAACARDAGDDMATGDSATLSQTAGGDVAGTMLSPAAVTAFLSTVNQGEIEAGQLAQEKATNAQVRQFAQMMVRDHRQADSAATGMAPSSGATGQTDATARRPDSAAGNMPGQPGATSQSGSAAGAQGSLASVTADMHAKHQQLMTSLRNTPRGRGFDSTYMAAMVTGHQEALQQLQQMRSGIGSTAGGTTPAAGARTDTGARAATGTTQSAGTQTGGTMQSHVESAVQMVQRHLERAQEIQRSLDGNDG